LYRKPQHNPGDAGASAGSEMRIPAILESTKALRLLRGYWRGTVVMRENEPARRRRSQADHAQFRIPICMLETKIWSHLPLCGNESRKIIIGCSENSVDPIFYLPKGRNPWQRHPSAGNSAIADLWASTSHSRNQHNFQVWRADILPADRRPD